jgi:glycolate oxidase FAD binding subunit
VLAEEKALHGLRAHEPAELYVTVGAATPLQALEQHLAAHGQQLAFEPPRFGERGTVGGAVATGFSGPARPYRGSLRDALLGLALIDGQGQLLRFGGTVIKNVAGFDAARLMVGAMGQLGLITEVTFKLQPLDAARLTLRFEAPQADALHAMNQAAAQGLPLSASAWWNGSLLLRLAGSAEAVQAAARRLGGEALDAASADAFWAGLRHQSDEFFVGAVKALTAGSGVSLWRLSLPATAPVLQAPGEQLVEWGGALRWLVTPLDGRSVRELAARAGGEATLYASARKGELPVFPLPAAANARILERLRRQFDPAGVFNPGRLGG